MKVYFVASIRGKKEHLESYKKIIDVLKEIGSEVIENTIAPSEKEVYSLSDDKKVKYYKKVLGWIREADVVLVETSFSSLGVGYEISLALEAGKPVIVLYKSGHAPHFLEGYQSDKLAIFKYDHTNLKKIVEEAIDVSSQKSDTRFNFFISRKLAAYLDWIAREKKIPRAVYLRKLIRAEMKESKEFGGED